ncbi:MAG: hypothetical protein N5P05_003483 [Chroococcopsis gigantea SAG 12.99]|jgi:Zn-dependent peptidase ImmA (M78 family)|nr:ImmA/IrrE family metallo-endopeptidase [Chlorogloea purpurea SAG 13.99]MDV3001877.1 hypothetical protein [Chroococcopsis gigantea SAG 12.99]
MSYPLIKPFKFLHKQQIEDKAVDILAQMDKTSKYGVKWPLDASRVAEFLGLDVVWDNIPDDEEGKIAARILPVEKLIEINDSITELRGGFAESTIAHEIGHWVLHIDPIAVTKYLQLSHKGLVIKVEPLLCRNDLILQGIEWQAQYFASCLLMPGFKLEQSCRGKELSQWRHLYAIADELGVTISNLIHRLKDTGWIYNVTSDKRIELISEANLYG